ncbi:hypothetical protein [Paraburkholderia caribensis]|uniref:hypothetical protein n=1 Tax=Paraburkholderia caribensis TaxID=75105 RepID=UPI0015927824|nr:hypothetical protein [Paraburkholderia caribensis]MDR6382941.1 hypothetical protein [Paraburkholderia caribensis]CAG9220758.1 conserved hypothetical protein [Paraburkholderia caribensis]
MTDSVSYLIQLLDQRADSSWANELRSVLLSPDLNADLVGCQHCMVHFALSQAQRRLESSRRLNKTTFGIEDLISELRQLNEDQTLDYYVVSTSRHLGTCYVDKDRLIGCEFVEKGGAKTKPGLWTDGKQVM